MIILYGIKNCDTVKKARSWLRQHKIEYRFHDFRADGLTEKQVRAWVAVLGWEPLLNKRGLTWRQLPATKKVNMSRECAIALMLAQPAVIKRPLLALYSKYQLGFDSTDYARLFS